MRVESSRAGGRVVRPSFSLQSLFVEYETPYSTRSAHVAYDAFRSLGPNAVVKTRQVPSYYLHKSLFDTIENVNEMFIYEVKPYLTIHNHLNFILYF